MEIVIITLCLGTIASAGTLATLIFKKQKLKNTTEKMPKEQKPMEIDAETIKLVEKHYLKENVVSKDNKATNASTNSTMRPTETKNHNSKFAPTSQSVKSRSPIEDDFEMTL